MKANFELPGEEPTPMGHIDDPESWSLMPKEESPDKDGQNLAEPSRTQEPLPEDDLARNEGEAHSELDKTTRH